MTVPPELPVRVGKARPLTPNPLSPEGEGALDQAISMMVTLAMPPPSHMVCRPQRLPRAFRP